MKKRVSILTDRMDRCYVCDSVDNVEIHEIFYGPKRNSSIRYGLVVPLCAEHHRGTYGVHGSKGKMINVSLKEEGQRAFEKQYPATDFMTVFGKNYL
jgi:hypothetical protein